MYNRYISQPDGSFRKKSEREPIPLEPQKEAQPRPEPPKKEEPAIEPISVPVQLTKEPEMTAESPPHPPAPVQEKERPTPPRTPGNPGTFLRNLLPQNFDTGDLLVVLLLLLIAGDGTDSGTAIMTLALYLFL